MIFITYCSNIGAILISNKQVSIGAITYFEFQHCPNIQATLCQCCLFVGARLFPISNKQVSIGAITYFEFQHCPNIQATLSQCCLFVGAILFPISIFQYSGNFNKICIAPIFFPTFTQYWRCTLPQ